MTYEDNYCASILEKYKAREINVFKLEKLGNLIERWIINTYNIQPTFELSGSIAKETAISLSSDVDYIVSMPDFNDTKKQMFLNLYQFLKTNYEAKKQNVSIRIYLNNLNVDITPARNIGYSDRTIYFSKRDTWGKTNISRHINDVKKSGRQNEIKLLKIWRELHKLDFCSTYLEYLLINSEYFSGILDYKPTVDENYNNLWKNFKYILEQLSKSKSENILFKQLRDPSNTNNIISDSESRETKNKIIEQAKIDYNEKCLSKIFKQ